MGKTIEGFTEDKFSEVCDSTQKKLNSKERLGFQVQSIAKDELWLEQSHYPASIGFTNISHKPTQQRQFGEFRATSMQLRHC